MKAKQTERGFIIIEHEMYASLDHNKTRLIQESSILGDYQDSLDNPGSSCLWIGKDHHLNREEVKELIEYMQYWLDNKGLKF